MAHKMKLLCIGTDTVGVSVSTWFENAQSLIMRHEQLIHFVQEEVLA